MKLSSKEREIPLNAKIGRGNHRQYAAYFKAPTTLDRGRRKPVEERGVIERYSESLVASGLSGFSNIISNEHDPPDCFASDCSENKISFELTELVYRQAIEANIAATYLGKGTVHRDWQLPDVVTELASIIDEKDRKCANACVSNGDLSHLVLVIFTDEPDLDYYSYKASLETYRFARPTHFAEVILLFSYDPRIGFCPFISLKFA